ncbi:hypothetical protein RN001_012564 [Aquatica leii]|uniref:F-box only protein 21 n=1 Tax=Aquatica leii TaxID=1421715 RepID=A0AAN7PUJ6_9COLE|nr:hypothetical protein RN001_012564 [Aquatica leii]
MEQLPPEILELIISNHKLTIEDVFNCSKTCTTLHEIILNSSFIWKHKYKQNWPQFMNLFDRNFNNWLDEIRYIFDLTKRTHLLLSMMSARFYKKNELSYCDLDEWANLIQESPRVYDYVVLDLMTIIHCNEPIKSIQVVPVDTPGNKTLQYYATKVLRFIRQLHLSTEWEEFVLLPGQYQILEKGATLIAQWCQPTLDIKWSNISSQLDELATQVRLTLLSKNPNHPLHKVSIETLEKWKCQNLEDNHWNVFECQELIHCLTVVLYNQYEFKGNNSAYYMPENSYINEVLSKRQGLPITLAIIYESVARRVGVKCEPINFPAHFLLRFTEGRKDKPGNTYYIDVFNNGSIIHKGVCPHSRFSDGTSRLGCATAREVVERMANNLEVSCRQHINPHGNITPLRSTLELCHLINPQELSTVVSLARVYMWHNIDTKRLENFLLTRGSGASHQEQRVVHMLRDYDLHLRHNFSEPFMQIEPKARPKNLLYAVGMVMRHLIFNYICVIYDWDRVCTASAEWQQQMGVHKLKLKDQQPFYNVLVEDGSHRYVAQENMVSTDNTGFLYLNEDLGRYFSHFFETHYVPNAEKEKEFPADTDVRHMYHKKLKGLQ